MEKKKEEEEEEKKFKKIKGWRGRFNSAGCPHQNRDCQKEIGRGTSYFITITLLVIPRYSFPSIYPLPYGFVAFLCGSLSRWRPKPLPGHVAFLNYHVTSLQATWRGLFFFFSLLSQKQKKARPRGLSLPPPPSPLPHLSLLLHSLPSLPSLSLRFSVN